MHRHLPDGSQAKDGGIVAQAQMPIADARQGELGGIETDRLLPAHALWQAPDGILFPSVRAAQAAIPRHAIAYLPALHAFSQLDDAPHAHIAQANGELGPGVLIEARAVKHGHLGAVFGGAKLAARSDMSRGNRLLLIGLQHCFVRLWGQQFSKHVCLLAFASLNRWLGTSAPIVAPLM